MRKFMSWFLALVIMAVFVGPAQGVVFRDILTHWAEYDILRINARGLMSGDGNGNFKPDNPISRQEAATLLVRLTGGEAQARGAAARSGVENVARGLSGWAAGYVGVALQQGIIDYNEVRILDWSGAAQRQEVAEWLSKALKLTPLVGDQGMLNQFKDVDQISAQKGPYIIPLVKDGILAGTSTGYFKPLDSMKRAEIAALLNRVLVKYPAPGIAGNLSVLVPDVNSGNMSVVGDVEDINWSQGMVEVYSNGHQLRYQMSTARSSSNFDTDIRSGDEVVLTVNNGLVTSLRLVNARRDSKSSRSNGNDCVVYRAVLDNVDTSNKKIKLESGTVKELDNGNWKSRSGSLTLKVASRVDVYYDGDDINFSKLEDYEGDTVYVAYDDDQDETVKIRVKKGSESHYDDTIKSVSSSSFKLKHDNDTVYYDDSTIVIRDGELIDGRDLDKDDDVYVVVDRSGSKDYAAVVAAGYTYGWRSSSDDDNYMVYKAILDQVDWGNREIELKSLYYMEDGWQSSSAYKTLEVTSRTDIYNGQNTIDGEDLKKYRDNTVYVAYDRDRQEVVKIRVLKGSNSYFIDNIRSINNSNIKMVNNKRTVYYDSSTIIIRDGELIKGRDLEEDDRVRVEVDRVDGSDYAAVVEVD